MKTSDPGSWMGLGGQAAVKTLKIHDQGFVDSVVVKVRAAEGGGEVEVGG